MPYKVRLGNDQTPRNVYIGLVTNSAVRRVDGVCVCMRKEDETRFDGIGR